MLELPFDIFRSAADFGFDTIRQGPVSVLAGPFDFLII